MTTRWILQVLLATLAVLLVLLAVVAGFLLLALATEDQQLTRGLRWGAGLLLGGGAAAVTLLAITLAVDRLLMDPHPSQPLDAVDEEP